MLSSCHSCFQYGRNDLHHLVVHGPKLLTSSHFIPLCSQVTFDTCTDSAAKHYSCFVFADRRPRTISMTVLVIVEMFNALNNLSENQSLL